MAIDFPSSPTTGQTYTTSSGVTWIWDGVKWTATGAAAPLVLPMNDNRVINGDMRIDQRNGGASGTASGYTVDRWAYAASVAGKGTWARNLGGAATIQTGFLYYLGFQSSSAYASLAGDVFVFRQPIEADMVGDFAFGQPNAQPVTLSFWAYSNLTGTFSGAINGAATRSYPFTFSIPAANVWTRAAITIPGDTSGAWVLSGNGIGATVMFDLGNGSTFRGPANAWASADYRGVTGAVSAVATNAAFFLVTGVKLEIGSVATPFNRQSLAKSMADCQRYYYQGEIAYLANFPSGVTAGTTLFFPAIMRAVPTIASISQATFGGGGFPVRTAVYINNSANGVVWGGVTTSAQGGGGFRDTVSASAEL